jgi:hypothetical protein
VEDELREVERQLRDNRPELTGLELDAIKLRTMASTAPKSPPLQGIGMGAFMKSRVALVLVLALGVFMSGTGATLAVTGLAQSGSASSAQYPSNNNGKHATLGVHESGKSEGTPAATEPVVEEEAAQPVRQVATSSGSTLPFTGFLAIPVLIIGVGLLGAGVAMRMRNRSGDHTA